MRNNIIVFFLGVLLGLIPMYLENQRIKQTYQEDRATLESEAGRAQAELSEVSEKYRIALLRDQLASLVLELEHKNFGTARLQSTNFFNRVRDSLPEMETAAVRETLRELLSQRDEVTAALVSNDDRVATRLREIYQDFPRAATLAAPAEQNEPPKQARAPKPPNAPQKAR